MRIYPAVSKTSGDLEITGEGLLAETYDRLMVASAQTPTSGTVHSTLVGLKAGTAVTNITVICSATAAGVTLAKLALYDTAGTRLAVSAESSASFNSPGVKTLAMSGGPYTVPSDGAFYAAFIGVTGTGMPTLIGVPSFFARNAAIGTGKARTADQAGQTDMPSPATFSQGSIGFWFGIS